MSGPPGNFHIIFQFLDQFFLHTFYCNRESEEYLLYVNRWTIWGLKDEFVLLFSKRLRSLAWETIRGWENVMIRESHYYRTLGIR